MKTTLLLFFYLISYNLFAQTYYLPTVVHVLYFDQDEDMTTAEVEDLINHVNIGLRGLSQNNTVSRVLFDTLWADTQIQLCLATEDENGAATDGIVHQQLGSRIAIGDHFRAKGESAPWDTNLYLNIWISSMGAGSETSGGIATTPTVPHSNFPNPHIGIMLNNDCYNPGQILIHEVGHFLGLKHIYRDDIDDTPCSNNVINPEPACEPSFLTLNTCSNEASFWGTIDPPDMIENYMEYYGNCAKMFTKGQKTRMREYADIYYEEMINSQPTGCDFVLSNNGLEVSDGASKVYPNPTTGAATIECNDSFTYRLINLQGQILISGIGHQLSNFDLSPFPNGVYLLEVENSQQTSRHKVLKL